MTTLHVWLHGLDAGSLVLKDNGNLQFRYHEHYAGQDLPPLGHAMPLQSEAFPHRTCLAVFGGLLPEQDVRRAAARILGVSETNDFRLLEELGGDCAGAIEFHPEGRIPPTGAPGRPIDLDELDEILVGLPARPLAIGDAHRDARMSLAGAQGKLPVTVSDLDDALLLPEAGGQPSTHILKPEPAQFPGLVDNEHFCMSLARMLELGVSHVDTARTLTGLPYLVVERYDRDLLAMPVKRLHQEDMCQALARLPSEKYQSDGGPTFRDVVALLRAHAATPARDVARLWDALVFNVLIGNCDAHGKNYSLLYDSRRPTLAPLYDLVSTTQYDGMSTRLAMTIGGARHPEEVDVEALARCARECGYNPRAAVARARRLAAAAAQAADELATDASFANVIAAAIAKAVGRTAARWLD